MAAAGFHKRVMALALALLTVGAAACLGEDWKLEFETISVGHDHYGATIQIEPGEEFAVGLRSNGVHPEPRWHVSEIDATVVELAGPPEYDSEVRAPGDWEGEGFKPMQFIPGATFQFVAKAEGESRLVLDLRSEGEPIDQYLLTIVVTDDPCDIDETGPNVVRPFRCDEEVPPEPVAVVYDHYGWVVLVEPGAAFALGLRSNGLYPDRAWQVVELNGEVIQLESRDLSGVGLAYTDSPEPDQSLPDAPGTYLEFTANTLGESPLVLEVGDSGGPVDRFEITVLVVEDACEGPVLSLTFPGHPCE